MFRIARLTQIAVVAALGASMACSGNPGDFGPGEATKRHSDAIIGGTRASGYEEAALVEMYQNGQQTAACSGSIIAPKVVLTAGHCVDGFTSWVIKAPYANGGQQASSSGGTTYDWMEYPATTVNPNHHDVGLIFLATPITLSSYPQLAQSPLADNSNVVNIGRINNGTLSDTDLFVSSPIPVVDGSTQGFPFDYAAQQIIQEGDSGGPDEVPGSTPHLIVAVNSGAGSGEVLARVDLLYSWIQQQVNAHGGGGGGGGNPPPPDAGGGGNPPPPDAGGGGHVDSGTGGGGGGSTADSGSGGGGATDDAGTDPTAQDSGAANQGTNDPGTNWVTGSSSGCSMGASPTSSGALAFGIGLVAAGLIARRRRAA